MHSYGIVMEDLVSPHDADTISELMEAAQHEYRRRILELGFKSIEIPAAALAGGLQYLH